METTLMLMPGNNYNTLILQYTAEAAKKYHRICYVTLNKTYSLLVKRFKAKTIDSKRFFFVDCISPKIFKMKSTKTCLCLDSLDNLSSVADKILTMIKLNKIGAVIFDSVSSFLVYKSDKDVVEFFNYVLSFLEERDVDVMLTVLYEDAERPAVKQLKMRADKWKVELM